MVRHFVRLALILALLASLYVLKVGAQDFGPPPPPAPTSSTTCTTFANGQGSGWVCTGPGR